MLEGSITAPAVATVLALRPDPLVLVADLPIREALADVELLGRHRLDLLHGFGPTGRSGPG